MSKSSLFTPVLISGCVILMLSFAIRASFGVFQIPVATEFGWPRAEFSLAIAIQNLAWGIGQPLFGAMAERFGDRKAIVAGALAYAGGLVLSSMAVTPLAHQTLAILVGFGIAGTGFGVVLAVVGRAASPENRSLTLGIATAAGSSPVAISGHGGGSEGVLIASWSLHRCARSRASPQQTAPPPVLPHSRRRSRGRHPLRRHYRRERKNARMSSTRSCGSSIAAKWPPAGIGVQRWTL